MTSSIASAASVPTSTSDFSNRKKKVIGYRPLTRKFAPPEDPTDTISNEATLRFEDFAELYLMEMETRWKPTTAYKKKAVVRGQLIPAFKDLRVHEITPIDVRRWQNDLMRHVTKKGKPYAPTYLRHLNTELACIFNYAVRFYGLHENPCVKAGSIGQLNAPEMDFWTRDEFTQFISAFEDRPASKTAFMVLYYTGLREGELLALTPADLNLTAGTLSVTKTYVRMNRMDVLSDPKTPKSKRTITLPQELCRCLRIHLLATGEPGPNERIFPFTRDHLYRELNYGCKTSGVKRIRIHDIRHSHASLLVELGCSPMLIAERLGHEKVQTTMDIYSHLYPNKQAEVAAQLNSIL